jgi:hypothetical protein
LEKCWSPVLLLGTIGLGGLVLYLLYHRTNTWPRWLFFFFLTIFGAGAALPVVYIIHRRAANQYVPAKVILREAILLGVFLDLWAWLQIGRIASNLIVLILLVDWSAGNIPAHGRKSNLQC